MKKLLVLLVTLMIAGSAGAEGIDRPAELPSATPIPDVIAVPDGTTRPIVTATPRPADAPLPEDPFIANAVEIARRIELLAESSLFMAYWNDTEATQAQIDALTGGDHTLPECIYHLRGEVLTEALMQDLKPGMMIDLERVELRRELVEPLPEMLLMGRDQAERALISLLARYKVFAMEDAQGCGVLMMLYREAVPVLVTWYADQGAVRMAAWFLPDEGLAACQDAGAVSAWFALTGLPEVAFEEVYRQ